MGNAKAVYLCIILSGLALPKWASTDSLIQASFDALNSGRAGEAKRFAQDAMTRARSAGNDSAYNWATFRLANAFQASGNYQGASPLYQALIQNADIQGDTKLLTKALTHYGALLVATGKYLDGENSIQQAVDLLKSKHDRSELAVCYSHLGNSRYWQEDYHEALDFYKQSLQLADSSEIRPLMAANLQNIGQVHADLEEYQKAEEHTRQALAIRLKLGDAYHVNQCFQNLLYLHVNQEHWQEALAVNAEFYETLETHGMMLDPEQVEPQAYVLSEIRQAYDRETQRWLLAIISLAALIAVFITGVLWRWRVLRKRAQTLEYQLAATKLATQNHHAPKNVKDVPTHPSGLSFIERVHPLLTHKNELLAPCYTLLAAGASITHIARTLNRSRRRIHQYIQDIAKLLDIAPEQVKEDALYYGRQRP